jgi:hypothetical protein
VAAFAEAGVTTLIVHPLTTDPDEYLRYVEELIRHHRGTAQRGVPHGVVSSARGPQVCGIVVNAAAVGVVGLSAIRVSRLRADFTGDEATVNAALTLVTVAANLGELELIARSDGGRRAALAADR